MMKHFVKIRLLFRGQATSNSNNQMSLLAFVMSFFFVVYTKVKWYKNMFGKNLIKKKKNCR